MPLRVSTIDFTGIERASVRGTNVAPFWLARANLPPRGSLTNTFALDRLDVHRLAEHRRIRLGLGQVALAAGQRDRLLQAEVAHRDPAAPDLRQRAVAAVGDGPLRPAYGRRRVAPARAEAALGVAAQAALARFERRAAFAPPLAGLGSSVKFDALQLERRQALRARPARLEHLEDAGRERAVLDVALGRAPRARDPRPAAARVDPSCRSGSRAAGSPARSPCPSGSRAPRPPGRSDAHAVAERLDHGALAEPGPEHRVLELPRRLVLAHVLAPSTRRSSGRASRCRPALLCADGLTVEPAEGIARVDRDRRVALDHVEGLVLVARDRRGSGPSCPRPRSPTRWLACGSSPALVWLQYSSLKLPSPGRLIGSVSSLVGGGLRRPVVDLVLEGDRRLAGGRVHRQRDRARRASSRARSERLSTGRTRRRRCRRPRPAGGRRRADPCRAAGSRWPRRWRGFAAEWRASGSCRRCRRAGRAAGWR